MKLLAGLLFVTPCLLYLTKGIKAQIPCPVPEEVIFLGAETAPVPLTYFLLFTRINKYYPQNVTGCFNNSNFDPNKKTYFLIHGLDSTPYLEHMIYLKTSILHREDCNVIMVDWREGSSNFIYPFSIKNCLIVGKYIAEQLEFLKSCRNLDLKNVHVIGFSLGGQTAGFVGKYIKTGKIGRITGLDITGACFVSFSSKYKLHYSDASFVDVITAAEYSEVIMIQETGHVHFKPDGGQVGRGCADDPETQFLCSHLRAVYLFASTYYANCLPVAYICPDYDIFKRGECFECGTNGEQCAAMGREAIEYADKTINGTRVMYLATTFTDDYCLYQYHVEVSIGSYPNSTVETGKLAVITDTSLQLLNKDLYFQETSEQFEPETKYTYLRLSTHVYDSATPFQFIWYTIEPRIDSKLYVECVKIVPMNNLQTDRSDLTIFLTTNGHGILPEDIVNLNVVDYC